MKLKAIANLDFCGGNSKRRCELVSITSVLEDMRRDSCLLQKPFLFLISFLFLALVAPTTSYSQEAITIEEPQYAGGIFYVKPPDKVILLEEQKVSWRRGNVIDNLNGIGGLWKISDLKSNVELPQSEKHHFLVNVGYNATVDPVRYIKIFKLEQKANKKKPNKGYRFIKTDANGNFYRTDLIPFNAAKYKEHSFLITVTQPLAVGEYAIMLENNGSIHMFGIKK